MKNTSIWSESATPKRFEKLDGDTKTDVLIIGGGIAGIMTAHKLKEQRIDYLLVEKDKICGGTTHNTTAKITAQHGFIYQKLIKSFGSELAKLYYDAGITAIEKYKMLATDYECDFETKNNYVYTLDSTALEKEANALQRLDIPFKQVDRLEIPVKAYGAICFENQAQFNPLKLLYSLAKGLNIRENTFVTSIEGNVAHTSDGMEIRAKRIILTTHFPYVSRHGLYPLRLYQHRSYVLALENAQPLNGMYVDNSETGLSFRSYGKKLLLGGGGHRTGKSGGGWAELVSFAKSNYPNAVEAARWATQDCMSLDSAPYIGAFSTARPDVLVATGFNKWGMTTAVTASEVLCDILLGKKSPYERLFNPSRSILTPQLLTNAYEATTNLINLKPKRCTHLGCALKWNDAEQSWDCPCHGSRYDDNGTVINNPAKDDFMQ